MTIKVACIFGVMAKEAQVIDTHAHLDMEQFDRDRDETIRRAGSAGVNTIVTVGADLESSRKAINLAETYPGLFATAGFHPHEAGRMKKADIESLAAMAVNSRVVAVGEIGLDFYRNRSPRESQLQAIQWQLELAERLKLPVIIHCRQAEKDMLPLLNSWTSSYTPPDGRPPGVIHCFNSDVTTAEQYLKMGFFISFGAYIGYPASRHMYEVIRYIPQDRLVVETDCPYLPPQSHRGQRNEPAYVVSTVETLARIRDVSPLAIAQSTTANAIRLFNLSV